MHSSAGVALVSGVRPEKIAPAHLELRSALSTVSSPFTEILDANHLAEGEGYLDRDRAFKASQLYTELTASQSAFAAMNDKIAALSPPSFSAIQYPPTNLGGLIDLLGHDNSQEARDCSDALLVELEHRDYFGLTAPVVTTLSMDLKSMVDEMQSSQTAPARKEALRGQIKQLKASWTPTEARYRANMAAASKNFANTHHPLFQRLTAMYSLNADAFIYLRTLVP
jgi:hypothetical protein